MRGVRCQFPDAIPLERDRSLRVIVKGRPESFGKVPCVELKPDMGSYSSFKINSNDQVAGALKIIRHASTL